MERTEEEKEKESKKSAIKNIIAGKDRKADIHKKEQVKVFYDHFMWPGHSSN